MDNNISDIKDPYTRSEVIANEENGNSKTASIEKLADSEKPSKEGIENMSQDLTPEKIETRL